MSTDTHQIKLTVREYITILARRSSERVPNLIEEMKTCTASLTALVAEAQDADITLDDDAVAANPVAANIRKRVDKVMIDADAIRKEQQLIDAMSNRAKQLSATLSMSALVPLSFDEGLFLTGINRQELGIA